LHEQTIIERTALPKEINMTERTTHATGSHVVDNTNIQTAGPRGPALLQAPDMHPACSGDCQAMGSHDICIVRGARAGARLVDRFCRRGRRRRAAGVRQSLQRPPRDRANLNKIGPSLAGVFRRKGGTEAGFALKAAAIPWDEKSLD
jgi:hypothetical protein